MKLKRIAPLRVRKALWKAYVGAKGNFKNGIREYNTFKYHVRDNFISYKSCNTGIDNAKISIVIPTLSKDSQADHLPKLERLLTEYLPGQTYKNYEAIVFCDGPNKLVVDRVLSINDNRIKVLATDSRKAKWGHPQTRLGIAAATGAFFVRMNDDNKPYKNYLETLMNGFKADEGITYGRVIFKGDARRVWNSALVSSYVLPGDKSGSLRLGNIDCMNYMIKINFAKKYATKWNDSCEADWIFLESLLKEGIKARFVDKIIGEKF